MKKKRRSAFLLESLEARLLFSADLAPLPVDGGNSGAEVPSDLEISLRPDNGGVQASDTNEQGRREVIFVDEAVDDFDQLIADLEMQLEKGRLFDIVGLDSGHDGIAQISDYLSQQQGVDAVHILSHGTDGEVILGNSRLNATTLDGYAEAIEGWRQSLTGDADLLFYGCNLAAGDDGQDLVNSLTLLSDADVAASDDVTGSAQFGGDWVLEYGKGEIETEVAVNGATQQNWNGVLTDFTVNTTNDTADADLGDGVAEDFAGNTSLRAAIMQANALGGINEITLNAGTYTLSLGELNVTSQLTITGAGAAVTVIDADSLDRVFNLNSNAANLILTDLTVTGGSINNKGGGIYVNDSSAQLTAMRVIITGNIGDDGAGIFNEGTMTLTDVVLSNNGDASTKEGGGIHNRDEAILNRVTISGNRAEDPGGHGGGIHNDGTATSLSLTNVTFSDNSASDEGGGLHTEKLVTIVNSTFTLNSADNGGGISNNGGTVNVHNTIVADNSAITTNPDVQGTFSSDGFNLIGDKGAAIGFTDGVNGDQAGTTGSPIDPLLGSLRDNGGFTPTHALLTGSPAIDAGDNSVALTDDQRGYARPIDGDGDATATIDIGAFEYTIGSLGTVDEFLVNDSNETGIQETSGDVDHSQRAVAVADDGSYVVVWSSEGQDASGWGVYAQRFDKFGTELTGEFLVNEIETGNERWARVVSDGSGNFVVTWTSNHGGPNDVYARRFDNSGAALAGEFRVNTTTANAQQDSSIAMDAFGNFIVVWEGDGTGDANGVFYRRYNADGTDMDPTEQRANQTPPGTQQDASVAMSAAGDFVVVWEEGGRIKFQMFANDGTPGTAKEVYTGTVSSNPDVAMDALGNFVVVYRWNGSGSGIWGHKFDSSGNEPGSWWRVGPGGVGVNKDHTNPSITMDDTGNFIVTYESVSEGEVGNKTVFAERFQSDTTSLGEFVVNQTTAGDQHMASIAMLDLDNYVVAFTGEDADQTGIFVRQFGTAVNSAPTADPGGPYTISEGDTLNLDASASADPDGTIVSWDWDIGDNGSFEKSGETVSYAWADLNAAGVIDDGTVDVTLRVTDNDGVQTLQTFQVTVDNTAPTLTVSGNLTTDDGAVYTLNLSKTDPGNDTMTWTINWGDGTVDSVAGSASTATHTYTGEGLTYNITVSASDEDGSYHDNHLLVADSAGDKIVRFAPGSNTVLGEFANNDLFSIDGAVIGPDGMLYAGSFGAGEIKRYDPSTGVRDLSFLASDGLGQVAQMAFGPDGLLYVVNSNSNQIFTFDTSLPSPTASVFIDGAGYFSSPMGLLFHPDGSIYVGGYASDNVVRYDASGNNPVEVANAADGINGAQFLALGPDGAVFIASTTNDRIYHYDGSTVRLFASGAGVDGPLGVTFGPDGYLYVTSELNGTAEVFRYDTSNYVSSGYTPVAAEAYIDSGLTNPRGLVFIPSHQVTVNPANDAPTVVTNAPLNVPEEATRTITSAYLETTDPDNSPDQIIYTLISLPSGGWVRLNGTPLTLGQTFTQDDINNNRVTYRDDDDGETTSFQMTVSDGNTTLPAFSFSVNGQPINDAPVVSAPGSALNATEQIGLAIQATGFGVSDLDEADAGALSTLTVGEGTISVVEGNSGVTIDSGDGTGTVTLSGSIVQLNALLTGTSTGTITYLNNSDNPGSNTTLTVTVNDQGNTGSDPGLTGDGSSEEGTNNVTINIASVNDEPTLTTTADNPTFTEGGAAAGLFSATSVSTIESGQTITALTLTVTNVNDGGNEKLNIDGSSLALTDGNSGSTATNSLSYSISVSGTTATVTLTGGSLTTAATQTLVDAISYQNDSADPNTANRVVTLTELVDSGGIANGGDDTATLSGTSTVTVVSVNDEPTLTTTADNPTFTEGGAAVGLFSATSVSTIESGQTITALTLTVTNVNDGGNEKLNIDGSSLALTDGNFGTTATNSLSYSISVSGTTATVTLTGGTLSKAATQTLVDTISYQNDSADPDTANRVVTLTQLVDSGGIANGGDDTATLSAASTVTVVSVNDEPTITSVANTAATEDLAYSYTFTVNDVDVGDTLTLSAPTLPGWLSFDPATGILAGTPTNAHVGDHAVVLRVNDGTVDVDQSFTITVANVNDAGTVTIDNTTPAQGDTLTANVIDPDGASGAISFQWFSDGAAIGGATGKTYSTTQADVGRVITVTAVYTDALGTAESLTSAGTAAVTNVNETPVAVNDHLNVTEDHSMIFNSITDLLANDSDMDGDTVTISGFTQPANGTLADNGDGTFTYTPAGNFNGNDSFTYTISDGNGETATGTAIIVVTPVGDTPQVSNVSTNAEAQSGLIFINRNANDGPEVTHFKLSGITNGTLYLADGVTRIDNGDFITVSQGQAGLRFTPAPNSAADGSFNVESSEDGVSVASQSGIATSIITVLTTAPQPSASEHSPPLSDPEQATNDEVVEEENEDVEDLADETDVQADADNMFTVETPQTSTSSGIAKPSFNPGITLTNRADSNRNDDNTPDSSTLVSPQTLKLLLEAKNLGELKAALVKLDITTLSPDAYELMRSSLDAVKEEIGKEMMLDRAVLGSAIATSVGLSAGYVVWMLKGGSLLASVLSSLPAWQLADPLAILVGKKEEEDDQEDDSLETIIEEGSRRDESKKNKALELDNVSKGSTKQ